MQTVILAHGFWRNDLAFGVPYWNENGLPQVLKDKGYNVLETSVPWFSPLEVRAQSLAIQIVAAATASKDRVHVIGHSMGGLDARAAVQLSGSELPVAGSIESITTLATPHWGSAFADYIQTVKLDNILTRIHHVLGLNLKGIKDLTHAARVEWNEKYRVLENLLYDPDNGQIRLTCWAGTQKADDLFWPLLFSWKVINRAPSMLTIPGLGGKPDKQHPYFAGGENDGMVSIKSALNWDGPGYKPADDLAYLDHLNFAGHWDPAEVDAFGREEDPLHSSKWINDFRDYYRAFAERVVEGIKS